MLPDSSFHFRAVELVWLWLNSTASVKIAPHLLTDTLLQFVFLHQCYGLIEWYIHFELIRITSLKWFINMVWGLLCGCCIWPFWVHSFVRSINQSIDQSINHWNQSSIIEINHWNQNQSLKPVNPSINEPLCTGVRFNTWRPRQDGRHFADDILK